MAKVNVIQGSLTAKCVEMYRRMGGERETESLPGLLWVLCIMPVFLFACPVLDGKLRVPPSFWVGFGLILGKIAGF